MKRAVKTNLLVLLVGSIHICFWEISCAQGPPTQDVCCEIKALESQIDSIESISICLAKKTKRPYKSVWDSDPSKPSHDNSVINECNKNSKDFKPSQYLIGKRSWLRSLRDQAIDNQLHLIMADQCSQCQSNGNYYVSQNNIASRSGAIVGEKEMQAIEREPEEEADGVDIFDPKDFISDPITYDNKVQFDAMDDIEYGRRDNPKKFICIIYDPKSSEYGIDFLYKVQNNGIWDRLKSFGNAETYLNKNGEIPEMLMNAGIFNPKFEPEGLWYRNSHKVFDFNNKTGLQGNFYMDPGGVFAIKKGGGATILTREELIKNIQDTVTYNYATQSGPMLVINGKLHPKFKSKSQNFHIRNGVGILPDGKIVFVMSKDEVNLFEFALLFRDGFKCKEALYLDGTISRIYAPQINRRDHGGNFAGIIAIYRKIK